MLALHDYLEKQLDALASCLLQFEQIYQQEVSLETRAAIPPWHAEIRSKAVWDKLSKCLESYVIAAEWGFERLPIKPFSQSSKALFWGHSTQRSHTELLIFAARCRLANLKGEIEPNHPTSNPDRMWESLSQRFIGHGWDELHAVQSAREIRQLALHTEPIDVEDEVYDVEASTFGPFNCRIENGEILVELEPRAHTSKQASEAKCEHFLWPKFPLEEDDAYSAEWKAFERSGAPEPGRTYQLMTWHHSPSDPEDLDSQIRIPFVLPTEFEKEVLRRCLPGSDVNNPPWDIIATRIGGIGWGRQNRSATAAVLIDLLNEKQSIGTRAADSKEPKAGVTPIPDKDADDKPQLVDRSQIAAAVHLSESGMTKYTSNWGEPVVVASGRRKAQWNYSEILPTLKRQFAVFVWPEHSPPSGQLVKRIE